MNWLLFTVYYLKLIADVLRGRHRTDHPLNPKWRWMHWQRMRKQRMGKLF